MKTIISLCLVSSTLFFVACGKDEAPTTSGQRPDLSGGSENPVTVPVKIELINDYIETAFLKTFINNKELFEVSGDVDYNDGTVYTTAATGKNTVTVIVNAPNGGSIVINDSEAHTYCQDVSAGEEAEVNFSDVLFAADKNITITYLPGACTAGNQP